jgi:protein TonB
MITTVPVHLAPTGPDRRGERTPPAATSRTAVTGSWRYAASHRTRGTVIVAALLSIALHAGVLFGIRPAKTKRVVVKEKPVMALLLSMPKIEELEEPEVLPGDEPKPTDTATLVPMQADLPQLSRPTEFVQPINFTSLVDKPDLSNLSISVIPDQYRGGRAIAENIGKIFNLSDLDRTPEPVLQQAPIYPMALKREGLSGTVKVQFIVDADGRVLDARAVESSHTGFEEAAVAAVGRWKFRPGVKAGRKVNTRMAVPILFTLEEPTIQ